jgi:hypothetical protein
MTIDSQREFKALADRLALEAISAPALEHRVLRNLWRIDDDTGPRARANREHAIEHVLAIYRGHGLRGDTTGNNPGSKWVAFNAIAEHLDYGAPLHDQDQSGAALLRGHLPQAASARAGVGGVNPVA